MASPAQPLAPRASTGSEFLDLITQDYSSGTKVGNDAVVLSLALSLGLSAFIGIAFCIVRPYNNVVYAPRAKHADSKHAPPPVTKSLLGWVPPLLRTKELDLIETVGLDAALFMRVGRMLRWIFTVLTVLGCGILIPINIAAYKSNPFGDIGPQPFLVIVTPRFLFGSDKVWAYVVCAYLFDAVIMLFLWWNYRAVLRLRRAYFDSSEYQRSLHARTLLVTEVPKESRTDEGIVRIVESAKGMGSDVPRASIARNVKDLPELVEEHTDTVKRLEVYLAKYLKNPDRVAAKRPVCKVSANDRSYAKGQRVDAIEYLTARIKQLELEIQQVRESVDKRNALPYGFASYASISDAHTVAYACRKKSPDGTLITLAPRPNDLVWKNLKVSAKQRRWRNFINTVWITLLTLFWVVPNTLIAVFLANLTNLGLVWHAFKTSLEQNPKTWALVQGILAPALTTLFYFFLPAVFRRLAINAGDMTKTARDRHVTRSLYSFFVFNNLVVFSLFSSCASLAITIAQTGKVPDNGFTLVLSSLCSLSPYWLSWLLQRNLGAAVDLSQLFPLIWGSFSRRFRSPTPRHLIELTAPQPFDFPGYYNLFMFYATVAVCFAPINPLVLAVTAFYFWLDTFLKKYLLLYVFITKYESGGAMWRIVFNRMLFLALLGNAVIALVVIGEATIAWHWNMLAAMAPLPVVIALFKWYCAAAFDDKISYYQKGTLAVDAEFHAGSESKRAHKSDRVGVRFGHPVLYTPLITPMVSAKSQHLLKSIYSGRTSLDGTHTAAPAGGYSDVYLDNMDAEGKTTKLGSAPFEFVSENELDFEHFKNRPEFRVQAGGDGQLFGHAQDLIRAGTPGSSITAFTRTGTMDSFGSSHRHNSSADSFDGPANPHSRSASHASDATKVGVEYPRGYHQTPSALREHSPAPSDDAPGGPPSGVRHYHQSSATESHENLVAAAARMPLSNPATYAPVRYAGLPANSPLGTPADENEDTSYDYFRRGRMAGR